MPIYVCDCVNGIFRAELMRKPSDNVRNFGNMWHINFNSIADSQLKPLNSTFWHFNWGTVFELDHVLIL
jgi:hypothetical protein